MHSQLTNRYCCCYSEILKFTKHVHFAKNSVYHIFTTVIVITFLKLHLEIFFIIDIIIFLVTTL